MGRIYDAEETLVEIICDRCGEKIISEDYYEDPQNKWDVICEGCMDDVLDEIKSDMRMTW